jgi:hypothetical protein
MNIFYSLFQNNWADLTTSQFSLLLVPWWWFLRPVSLPFDPRVVVFITDSLITPEPAM